MNRDPRITYIDSPYAEPTFVQNHVEDPRYIVRLPDGRHVAANADGKPIQNSEGRYDVWRGTDHLPPEAARATWRGTDPNVTTIQAPGADETARIRAELAKRYPGV